MSTSQPPENPQRDRPTFAEGEAQPEAHEQEQHVGTFAEGKERS